MEPASATKSRRSSPVLERNAARLRLATVSPSGLVADVKFPPTYVVSPTTRTVETLPFTRHDRSGTGDGVAWARCGRMRETTRMQVRATVERARGGRDMARPWR